MAKATTKPVEVDYFPITDIASMAAVMAPLVELDYRANITMCHGPDGQEATTLDCIKPLRVDLPAEDHVAACSGDVLVFDGVRLMSMTEADFTAKYEAEA